MIDAPGRAGRCTISAIFGSAEAVDEALYRLGLQGIPRDLVEVVVSEGAAQRHYAGRARKMGSRAVGFAAIGALIGLIAGSFLSLVVVAWPGQDLPRGAFLAQLLGPNAGSAIGVLVGGLYGALKRVSPSGAHARAAESDGIVLIVRHAALSDASRLSDLLRDGGGRDVRVDAATGA